MATATELALRFHQAGGLLDMTTVARNLTTMLLMNICPAQLFLLMTEGARFYSRRQGMIAQGRQREHFGAVRGFTGIVVTVKTGGCFALGIDPMGNEHLRIGRHQRITAAHALLRHALLDGDVELAGHEHPHDGRWYDLTAFMERHDGEMAFDWNDGGIAIEGSPIGLGHVIDAGRGIWGDGFADIVHIGGAVEPDILGFDVGLSYFFSDKSALPGTKGLVPDRRAPIPRHFGGPALGKGADVTDLATHLAGSMAIEDRITMRFGRMAPLAGWRVSLGSPQINTSATYFVVERRMTIDAGKPSTTFRKMNILFHSRIDRVQSHITTFGPVAATGRCMTP